MDLDISSLWSWTLPLWSLFLLVLFLGGVVSDTVVLEGATNVDLTRGVERNTGSL
jgi:hypothetical protein